MLPGLDRLWLSRAAAALVAHHPPAAGRPLVAVGYGEPSLVFLLGTDTAPGDAERRRRHPRATAAKPWSAAAMTPAFRQALSARGLAAQPLGSVSGLDYSNGQRMVLTLYDVAPG